MQIFLFAIIGYLAGSIPFGLLLTRWAGLGDVRSIGSGNIGATNVLRTGNKKIAALTLLCDSLKGFFPVLAASLFASPNAMIAAGLGALAGHLFPVWLKFKGGKGVATVIGVTLGWWWPTALVFAVVWLLMFYLTRISSLSAIVGSIAVYVYVVINSALGFLLSYEVIDKSWEKFGSQPPFVMWPFLVAFGAVVIMHHANIARLLKGEEPKSSFSKKS